MFFRNELFLKGHILNTSPYYSLVYARTGGSHLSSLGLCKRHTQSHGSWTTSDCQVKSQLMPRSSSTSCPLLIHPSIATPQGWCRGWDNHCGGRRYCFIARETGGFSTFAKEGLCICGWFPCLVGSLWPIPTKFPQRWMCSWGRRVSHFLTPAGLP